ncbi:hypothetical protein P4S95_02530 [Aneurinibacillus aneurinilyticus]|nr:hypothetical protein [Aneurinibacillus aneurinilyticus]
MEYSSFEKITVADFNEEEGRRIVEWLNAPRVTQMMVMHAAT